VRGVARWSFEGGKAGYQLAASLEGGHGLGDVLFGLRDNSKTSSVDMETVS
jgi:hypothetical protein